MRVLGLTHKSNLCSIVIYSESAVGVCKNIDGGISQELVAKLDSREPTFTVGWFRDPLF